MGSLQAIFLSFFSSNSWELSTDVVKDVNHTARSSTTFNADSWDNSDDSMICHSEQDPETWHVDLQAIENM